MLPHHKGVFTAEVMAELSLSCIRKRGVLKSWLRVGCGGKENQPPTPASPWSQSSRRAGVRDPATKQQPLAAALLSSPAPSILVSPRLPRIAVRRRPISLLSLPMPPLAVCYPKHLPTLYRPRADLQKSWFLPQSISVLSTGYSEIQKQTKRKIVFIFMYTHMTRSSRQATCSKCLYWAKAGSCSIFIVTNWYWSKIRLLCGLKNI